CALEMSSERRRPHGPVLSKAWRIPVRRFALRRAQRVVQSTFGARCPAARSPSLVRGMRRFAVLAMRRLLAPAPRGELPAEAHERYTTGCVDCHALACQTKPLRRAGARAGALETQLALRVDHAVPRY